MSGCGRSKRGLTLDLNAPPNTSKRLRATKAAPAPVLTTPDVNMLKLSSPELANFLVSNTLATPTPSTINTLNSNVANSSNVVNNSSSSDSVANSNNVVNSSDTVVNSSNCLDNSMATSSSDCSFTSKLATEEQKLYAQGFEEALKKLHNNNNNNNNSSNNNNKTKKNNKNVVNNLESRESVKDSATTTSTRRALSANSSVVTAIDTIERATSACSGLSTGSGVSISSQSMPSTVLSSVKEELEEEEEELDEMEEEETNTNDDEESLSSSAEDSSDAKGRSQVVSPIDLADQERIKLERKRQRNRVAASKCRKRKLERIAQLDDKVKCLKGENAELAAVVRRLKENICNLKQEVIQHANNGCHILSNADNNPIAPNVSC